MLHRVLLALGLACVLVSAVFAAGGGSRFYHSPTADLRLSAEEQQVSERIRHEFGLRGLPLPVLRPEIVLAARARATALLDADGPDLDRQRLEDLREGLRQAGVSDYPVRGGISRGTDPEAVIDGLIAWSRGLDAGGWNRMGVGVARNETHLSAVVLLTRHMVELAPVPRRLDAPGPITLAGKAPPGTGAIRLYLTAPNGTVSSLSPTRIASGGFSQEVLLGTLGLHQVEVLADEGRGPQVAALLHLCVGHCEHQRTLPDLAPPDGNDPSRARAYVYEWVNAFRRLHALPPLVADEGLRAVMEDHLSRLIPDAALSHHDTEGRGPAERLSEAGIEVIAFAENLGRHSRLDLLLEKLTESPAHRKNLLGAHLTHLGVGVLRHESANGWIVGQLFATFPPSATRPVQAP